MCHICDVTSSLRPFRENNRPLPAAEDGEQKQKCLEMPAKMSRQRRLCLAGFG
jgi:hypothetical protein